MKYGIKIIIAFFSVVPIISWAQQPDISRKIEAIIESHIGVLDEQTDVALMIQDLEGFVENPININATSASELSRLYVLTDVQIQKLLDYLKEYGPAYTIYELKTIDGFTHDLLQNIEPFIWFGPRVEQKKFSEAFQYSNNQVLLRALGNMQESKGYKLNSKNEIPFEGNRYRYYARYGFEASDRFSAGITAEKDPGESFFKSSNPQGFDFYSAHVAAHINSTFEQVVAGDYLVREGQGLVVWQGYTSGKSENVLAISKTNQGIRPSTAVDENLFFRGAATTVNFGNAKISVFYSQKRDDGNVAGSDSAGFVITSLQTSGYHRTVSEIDDKNAVRNINYGALFSMGFYNLKIGASLVRQQLSLPLVPARQLYNQYRFTGDENVTGGMDYSFNKGKYQLFGEAAMSKSGGKAFVQGAIINLTDRLGFSALFRHFDRDYHSQWANTFAEGTNMSNESGLYFGIKLLPFKYVTLSAYSDFYKSEWINYTTAAPSQGWDAMAQANVRFSKKVEFYIRFKNEEKALKKAVEERYVNIPETNRKIRLHFNYSPSEILTFKTRLEHVSYRALDKENGIMIFQDLKISPTRFPIDLSARLAWFVTDSYYSRIYAYENDLLYTFSVPSFFGKGMRTYLNVRYQISEKIDFWLKFGDTLWNNQNVISSGYNEIEGNHRTELKLQLRLKI